MSLCTVEQYRAKYIYCDLPDEYLNEWLADAEDVVNRVLREADADAGNLGDESAKTCERVVRDMVHRAIGDRAARSCSRAATGSARRSTWATASPTSSSASRNARTSWRRSASTG